MRTLVFLLTILTFGVRLSAQQNFPAKGEIFKDDVVPAIYITLSQDSLDEILDIANQYNDYHYKAKFVFDNGSIRDTLENIGFRLRGNTSRKAAKKSFKISFNTYESGRKYHGLEKMNINGEHNDPSITRTKLCFDMLNYLEVPASRTNHVRLYINGTYFGLYLNVEHIDEEFTKNRYDGEGNLYKCLYGADLAYRGAAASNYKLDYYELSNPKGSSDHEDLAKFITVLNNTEDKDFECELEKVFNVNNYLKSVVMDVLTGNWDGPNYNKNNFYLYFNPKNRLFEYIPYDLDNTLGVDFLGQEWTTRDLYQWSKGSSGRPLFDKIITRSTYKERYTYLLDKTITEYFNPDSMALKINELKSLINTAAKEDKIRTLDYGYTIADFNNSFGYFSKNHVKYGLADYINKRYNSASSQLNTLVNVGAIPYAYSYKIDYTTDSISFYIKTKGENPNPSVELMYNWESQSAIWYKTLEQVGPGVYETKIAWHPTLEELSFLFKLEDSGGKVINFPVCNMISIRKRRFDIPLYINELVADNESGIVDEEGKNEDWIELFYGGNGFVSLETLYITDDLSDPYKFPILSGTIGPKSFHLYWADNDTEDGIDHTNFKLGKVGEDVAIFDANGTMVDWVKYGIQTTDISFGRVEDGSDDWVFFNVPTPNASNSGINSVNRISKNSITLYPNPSSGLVNFSGAEYFSTIKVYSIDGRLVYSGNLNRKIDLSHCAIGSYILQLANESSVVNKRLILVR